MEQINASDFDIFGGRCHGDSVEASVIINVGNLLDAGIPTFGLKSVSGEHARFRSKAYRRTAHQRGRPMPASAWGQFGVRQPSGPRA